MSLFPVSLTGAYERVGLTLDASGARLPSAARHGRLRVRATAGGVSRSVTLRRGTLASR